MVASEHLNGEQFMHVNSLHPKKTTHPREFSGDDEEYNNYSTDSAASYDRLKKDISRRGVVSPLLVQREKKRTLVLDGHHRLQAAKELGITRLPVRYL